MRNGRHLKNPKMRDKRMVVSHLSLIFEFSNVYHSACVWPSTLKLGCVSNLDTLFLVMGLISLVESIYAN